MTATTPSPNYTRVWLTFLRNSLVREMTFRGNFVITVVTRAFWFATQLTLFGIIFEALASRSGEISGWTRWQYFAFMATGMLINASVEALFMPNCANFSELIRTGNLDFALLKPIDTQFLVSFEKMDLAMLNQVLLAASLLGVSLYKLGEPITAWQAVLYLVYVAFGVMMFYSLMISLASTSIWFGRNQGLYDFWFYITAFARYPQSIYLGTDMVIGNVLAIAFTWIIPVLLVVTVPARLLVKPLEKGNWGLAAVGLVAALSGLVISRAIFQWSLKSYRSASS